MASVVNRTMMKYLVQLFNPKSQGRNLGTATIHMGAITIISMSLVQIEWFEIIGVTCTPYLSLSQFFWVGYSNIAEYKCINNTIINLMRIIILWCFMAIIFSLGGFFLEIIAPKGNVYFFMRKYALASTCTVLWVMAIISTCYYVAVLLEDSLSTLYPKVDTVVTYGYGFYLIALTGVIALLGTFCTLISMHTLSDAYPPDDPCLIDDYHEHLESLNSRNIPPPPYNIPPPPYAP